MISLSIIETLKEVYEVIKSLFSALEKVFSGDIGGLYGALTATVYKDCLRKPADAIMSSANLSTIYSAILPVALMLIVIAFFTKLSEMAITDDLNIDKIIKEIIILVLVLMVMDNAVSVGSGKFGITDDSGWLQKFYHMITDISDDLLKSMKGSVTFDTISQTLNTQLNNIKTFNLTDFITSPLNLIMDVAGGLISFVLSMILSGIVYMIGIYRAVKIGVFVVLTPFGMATSYSNGTVGLKYIKKVIALYLQEPIGIISVYLLYSAFNSSGIVSSLLIAFIIPGMAISAIVKSEKRAQQLIGA